MSIPAAAVDMAAGVKPEVVAPEPVTPKIPSADRVMAQIKERLKAANPHLEPGYKPPQDKSNEEPAKDGAAPELVADPKATLAELGKAQAKVRELQDKLKASEGLTGDAQYGKELKELWAKDKLAALAKISGADPTDVLADLVTMFYDKDDSAPAKTGSEHVDNKLMAKLEEVTKKLEALEQGRTADSAAQEGAKLAQQQEAVNSFLGSMLDKHKDMFEISFRADNRKEALEKAIASAPDVVKRLGFDPAKLSAEQAEQVAKEALAEAEKHFEGIGQRYAKAGQAQSKPDRYSVPLRTRPAPIQRQGKQPNESFEAYKARINRELGFA